MSVALTGAALAGTDGGGGGIVITTWYLVGRGFVKSGWWRGVAGSCLALADSFEKLLYVNDMIQSNKSPGRPRSDFT